MSDQPVGDQPVRRRGRRPAGEDTRGDILAAARREFAGRGYDATTLRGVARAAAVDPRLVHHYFDGKDALFVEAMGFPVRPQDLVDRVLEPGIEGVGERLIRALLAVWDSPGGAARLRALLSGALSSEAGARMLREFLVREVLGRVAAQLELDRPQLRAALVASHVAGLALGRHVLRLDALVQADLDDLVAIVGPVVQHYLTDPGLAGRPIG